MIGAEGRKVRCPSCGHVWHATLPVPDAGGDPNPEPLETAEGVEAGTDVAFREPGSDEETADRPESVERFSQSLWNNIREMRQGDEGNGEPDQYDAFQPVEDEALDDDAIASVDPKKRRQRKVRLKKSKAYSLNPTALLKQAAPAFVAVGLILLALVYPSRELVVRAVPDLAGLYGLAGAEVNVHGIEISNFIAVREVVAGLPVMRIEGALFNVSPAERSIPTLRVALLDEAGEELLAWAHEPTLDVLNGEATVRVRTDLSSPPANAAAVAVRFLDEGEELPTVLR